MLDEGSLFFLFVASWITLTILYKNQFNSPHFNQIPIVAYRRLNQVDNGSSSDISLFISWINKAELTSEIFVADPVILHSSLPREKRTTLTKSHYIRKNITESYSSLTVDGITKSLTSFGIISKKKNQEKIEQFYADIATFTRSRVYRNPKFLGYKNLSKIMTDEKVVTEVLITMNNTYIQIRVFYPVSDDSNVLWTAKNSGDKRIMVEEIYEEIILTAGEVSLSDGSKLEMNFPSDIFGFLSQLESSTLIHCNQTSAIALLPHRKRDKQAYGLQSLMDMKSLSKTLNFPLFISSGTHLGWYRECAANSFTNDADYITWDAEFSNREFKEKVVQYTLHNKDSPVKLMYIFGNYTHGFEFSFQSNNYWKSDLFFMKHNYTDNKSYIASHWPTGHTFYYYYYPLMDTLCSGYFMNHKVNVPCQPLDMILGDYGPNWMTPIDSSHWSYTTSGFNRGPEMKWDQRRRQYEYFS